MKQLDINFPIDNFEKLLIKIGWNSIDEFFLFWDKRLDLLSINSFWGKTAKDDWIWGLALPLLSNAYKYKEYYKEKKIIGISALPGIGKTTLGSWLEKVSLKLDMKVSVISIDDFYLPSKEMEIAIKGNPWNVSRGFPGSHSVDLMHEKILDWKKTGILNVPVFDKAIRNGLGDRSHWRKETPDIVFIEGWFLGVKPIGKFTQKIDDYSPPLNSDEINYRLVIQNNLRHYIHIWSLIDTLWHIKPIEFKYVNSWKTNQENTMFKKRGKALQGERLKDFLRMINVSIPLKSFDKINSDFLLKINQNRKLLEVGIK